MNGTPSISESYSVVGGFWTGPEAVVPLALVVLPRGPSLFRPHLLERFHALGFSEILCVETGTPRYDTAGLVGRLPRLRILVHRTPLSGGEAVNLAAREIRRDKFLVLWDDQELVEPAPSRLGSLLGNGQVAVVPQRLDSQGRETPSVQVPGLQKDRLKILALGADQESVDTLFPPEYVALYDRERFYHTGGFDPDLGNSFWQKVDWGLRSRLWGASLVVNRTFQVRSTRNLRSEDQTPDRSYPRFYLRNLAVRHAGDHSVLPMARFGAHWRRSGLGLGASLRMFLQERQWVKTHRYLYKTDAKVLMELWGGA